jgi:hypothetical protein
MFGSVGSRYTSNINPKFDNYDIKNNPNQAKNKIADVKTCTDNNNVNKNPITANTTKTE